jgi:hypothetical protein
MNKFKLFPLVGLVIVTLFCSLLDSPGSVRGTALSNPGSANQGWIIDPQDLQGTWTGTPTR